MIQLIKQVDPPKAQIVTIPEGYSGQRIDNFLITNLKGVPKTRIYRMIRKGEVRINGGRAKPDSRIADGDNIRIPPVRMAASDTTGNFEFLEIEKSIIFENRFFSLLDYHLLFRAKFISVFMDLNTRTSIPIPDKVKLSLAKEIPSYIDGA